MYISYIEKNNKFFYSAIKGDLFTFNIFAQNMLDEYIYSKK